MIEIEYKTVPLTPLLEVPTRAHILYFYEDVNEYVNNACAYITTGIDLGHQILFIENSDIYALIERRLGSNKERVHFIDNRTFYGTHGDFHFHTIVRHFEEILRPFFDADISVRTWANVDWREQDNIIDKLDTFEAIADTSVNNMGIVSVCAYNAKTCPATLQTIMMRAHEYYMTDMELVRSPLYKGRVKGKSSVT